VTKTVWTTCVQLDAKRTTERKHSKFYGSVDV